MTNSTENLREATTHQKSQSQSNSFYHFIYLLNTKSYDNNCLCAFLYMLDSTIIIMLLLNLPPIGIIPTSTLNFGGIFGLFCYLFILVILIQFLLGLMYQKEIFLMLQFKIYRTCLFTLGFRFILEQISKQSILSSFIAIIILVIVLILVLFFSLFLGNQAYYKEQIKQDGLPINIGLMFWNMAFVWYERNIIDQTFNPFPIIIIMLLIAIFNRVWILDRSFRRSHHFQYKYYCIMASWNILLTVKLGYMRLDDEIDSNLLFYPLIPLLLVIFIAETLEMRSKFEYKNLFDKKLQKHQFLQLTQIIVQDLIYLKKDQKATLKQTSLIIFYYQHLKHCTFLNCQVSHQIVLKDFMSNTKNKNIVTKICKLMEKVFTQFCDAQPENLSLKLNFMRFYVLCFENKLRILELMSELESSQLDFFSKAQIYEIKQKVMEMQVSEMLENLKIQDSVTQFKNTMNLILNSLVDFWSQFFEERVDFSKILLVSDKLFPLMSSLEDQWNETIRMETHSAIKIMKMYVDYNRVIINDEKYATIVDDYMNLLSHKLEEMKQISYTDSETGLIVLSLSEATIGQIKMANDQVGSIFNYNKRDLLKKRVNELMPKLFSDQHDNYLFAFMKNKNKKVNTDERLLIGKEKNGYLFPIMLQLRKAFVTMNQELTFIANITKVKNTQSPILCICDDQGEIIDYSSMFFYLLIKVFKKEKPTYDTKKNIQSYISQFFQYVSLDEPAEEMVFAEQFDHALQGIIEIIFHVSIIHFPLKPNAGYLIRGLRRKGEKSKFYSQLSLTDSLIEIVNEDHLEMKPFSYKPDKNIFQLYNQINFHEKIYKIKSQETIPYMKLSNLMEVLEEKKKVQTFDENIKAIRLINGHFERIEEPESFTSEYDENEKKQSNNKLVQIKSELITNETMSYPSIFKCVNHIICFILIVFSIVIIVEMSFFPYEGKQSLQTISHKKNVRLLLSQYVVYFEAEIMSNQTAYFSEKKTQVRAQAIESINNAELPQKQKQLALKLVFLEKQGDLPELITDETFEIQEFQINFVGIFQIFWVLFGAMMLIKLIINFCFLKLYRKKLMEIYEFFLPLDENQIRKLHSNCVRLSKKISTKMVDGKEKEEEENQEIYSDEENENPVKKIKKFKNLTSIKEKKQIVQILMPTFFVGVLFIMGIIFFESWLDHIKEEQQAFYFLTDVLPEYSIEMMKVYSEKIYQTQYNVTDMFLEKYQRHQYQLSELSDHSDFKSQFYLPYLFNNPCSVITSDANFDCENIEDGILKEGISKAVNYIGIELRQIENNSTVTITEFDNLIKILYNSVKPIYKKISNEIKKELQKQYENGSINFSIVFIFFFIFFVLLDIYEYNYPLKAMEKELSSTKSLIKLIPEKRERNPEGYERI